MNPDQEAAALAVAHAFMIQNGITPPPVPAQQPQSSAPAEQPTTIFAEDPAPEPKVAQQALTTGTLRGPKQVALNDFMLRAAESGDPDFANLFDALGSPPARGSIRPIPRPAPPPHTLHAPYPSHTLSTPSGVGVMEQLLTEIGGLRASIDKLCMILGAK